MGKECCWKTTVIRVVDKSEKSKCKIAEVCGIPDCPHGLVVRIPGYRSRGPGLIPGATRFYEK
jgi:hypothetical protein